MSLSSSFEQNGRQFVCPGERVIFTCKINRTPIVRIAADGFISRSEPIFFSVSDDVGSHGHNDNTTFQPTLTNLQRKYNQCEVANFTVTLTITTTDETVNTVVECADVLTSDHVQKKDLTQSCKTE